MKNAFYSVGLVAVVALAAASSPLLAQVAPAADPAPAKAAAPKIQFSETAFDFGKVKPTEPCKHEFIVTNVGTATLEITAVQPGCGCTTAGDWDKKIEPGKTGKIPIQFNPGSFAGHVSKGVSVTCNDPAQANHYLQISATVWRPIDVQPQFAYFMPVLGEETNETKIVRITNNTDENITLEPPQSANPLFKAELKTVRTNKEFELLITYSGPITNAPPQGTVSIKTSSPTTPVINVSAAAMTQQAIVAFPTPVQLPAGPLKTDYQQAVTVRNNSRLPLKLTDPAINVEGARVQAKEIDPGKILQLTLTFPAGFQSKPGQSMELSFHTAHPKHPEIKIPITQLIPTPVPPTSASTGGGK